MNAPKLRFQEFSDEWNEQNFSDLYSFFSTNSFSREFLNYEIGETKNIHYGDIHTKFNTHFNINNEIVPFINTNVSLDRIKDSSYCQVGDLVIADASEDYADVGKTIEITNLGDNKVLAGLHTFLARPIDNATYTGFSSLLLKSWKSRKQIMTIAQGTKVLGISTGRLGKIKLDIPSLPEQQKIASFLGSVDKRIELLTKKKDLLEKYKKGVMQKLFSQEIRFKNENGNDYPDWEEKKLGEFLLLKSREILKPITNYLAIGVRSHAKGTFQKPNSDPNANSMEKLYVVRENDLIVNITFAWEGAIAIVKKNDNGGLVSHRFPTYIFDTSKTSHRFFKYVILDKRFRWDLDLISPGGAGRNRVLSKKEFIKLKIKLPSLPEQQKITNFLEAIDQKIEQTTQQLDGTKTFKKGLLQRMFV